MCRDTWERLSGRKNWAQEGRSGPFLDLIFLNYIQHHLMELPDHTITLPTTGRWCVTDTWTRRAGAGSQKSSWENTPQPRQLSTGTTRPGDPACNDPAPHSRDNTASHHGRKADFGEMGITPAQITPSWIVHGPSDIIKVRSTAGSWPKSVTPFSHWEGWGSAVKRCYSVFEGNIQPETYFSFYRRVNWP